MLQIIKSLTQIVLLSALIVSCNSEDDTGHVIVEPNEVIGNAPSAQANQDEYENRDVKEEANEDVKEDTEVVEDTKEIKEEASAEKETSSEMADFETLSVYFDQLDRIEALREYMQNEIADYANESIIDELNDFEKLTYSKLSDVVEKHDIENIDEYIAAVDSEMDFYEFDIELKWSDLEESIK